MVEPSVHEYSMIHIDIFTYYQDPYRQVDLKCKVQHTSSLNYVYICLYNIYIEIQRF